MHLTVLVPSLSFQNIWDLPLWLWRQYAEYADEDARRNREANRGS